MGTTPVRADVRYLDSKWKNSEEVAEIGTRDSRRGVTDRREVEIYDARAEAGKLDLDREGFVLRTLDPGPLAFRDAAVVKDVYFPMIQEFLKELTGATHVVTYEHVVRHESPATFDGAYARFVHSDYCMEDRHASAREYFARYGLELDPSRTWRFACYNTWQPIDWEVQQNPLALMDSTRLSEDDLVHYYYTGRGERARSTMPIYNEGHRFCYFPRMQTDEILAFKQLESRKGRALTSPHTSFFDPGAPGDALPRRSIEVRAMCAFGA